MELMFLKSIVLIILGKHHATDASFIIQDLDPDLSDVKDNLEKVESELLDLKTKMAGLQTRLEILEDDKDPTLQASKLTTACKDGWMAYKGSCYYFGTTKVTFSTAEEQCRSLDAHLVNVEHQDENSFLKDFMLSHDNEKIHYWVGITDEEEENIWKMTRGNATATVFDWKTSKEPKGGKVENCARFAGEHQYSWGDVSCSGVARYLCKQIVDYIDF